MRVILQVTDGPDNQGRLIWLQSGQSITLGRTERADYALPGDSALDEIHFQIQCQQAECFLFSRSSRGLKLNGRSVADGRLRNGDTIEAGRTRFTVEVEGSLGSQAESQGATSSDAADSPRESCTDPDLATTTAINPPVPCDSGAYLYRITGDLSGIHRVVHQLAGTGALHVVFNGPFESYRELAPTDVRLFDWLPERLAAASPAVLSHVPADQWCDIVRQAAGKDMATSFFSDLDQDQLLRHLRAAARGRMSEQGESVANHMLLTYEPSLLAERLPACEPTFGDFFFSRIQAVLFESEEQGEWLLMSGQKLDLDQLGDFTLTTQAAGERS